MVPLKVIEGALPSFFAVLKKVSAACKSVFAVSTAVWLAGFVLVSTAALYALSRAFHTLSVTQNFPDGTSEAFKAVSTPVLAISASLIPASRAVVSTSGLPPTGRILMENSFVLFPAVLGFVDK